MAGTAQGLTFLLVDDDLDLIRRLESRWRSTSVYVRPPALVNSEWANTLGAVDMVLWDWSKLASKESRRALREVQVHQPDLPMLILEADLKDESLAEIIEEPATDFVRSPLDFEELAYRVDRLLGARQREHREPTTTDCPRPVTIAPPLEHVAFDLHNPESGRLDARRVSELFGLPVRRIAAQLGRHPQTVSKTPDAPGLQQDLALFERIATALLHLVGTREGLRIWLNARNPQLEGKTPIELLTAGQGEVVAEMLEDFLVGQPA